MIRKDVPRRRKRSQSLTAMLVSLYCPFGNTSRGKTNQQRGIPTIFSRSRTNRTSTTIYDDVYTVTARRSRPRLSTWGHLGTLPNPRLTTEATNSQGHLAYPEWQNSCKNLHLETASFGQLLPGPKNFQVAEEISDGAPDAENEIFWPQRQ